MPRATDRPRSELHEVDSPEATQDVAATLAARLPGGSVVHLSGDLGTGKTQFAKGLARGLGLDPDDVLSPTFTLVHPHAPATGRADALGFVHVDLYRISNPADVEELGLSELPGSDAIAAVEWPERLGDRAAPGAVSVVLTDLGGTRRRIAIGWPDDDDLAPGRVT